MRNLSWYGPDLTDEEQTAADALDLLVRSNQATANRIASWPWLVDGVTTDEAQAVVQVQLLAAIDPASATEISVQSWFDDGIQEQEWRAVKHLRTIVRPGPFLFDAFKRRPWFQDNITADEEERPESFSKIVDPLGDGTGAGVGVAAKVVQLEWFHSQIGSVHRNRFMAVLAALLAWDPALGDKVAGMPFMAESIESHDIGLLQTLFELRGEDLDLLTSEPWFIDGIDDDEAIVVTILPSQVNRSPENFRNLLNVSFIDKGSTILPLAGEVSFAIIRLGAVGNGDVLPTLSKPPAR